MATIVASAWDGVDRAPNQEGACHHLYQNWEPVLGKATQAWKETPGCVVHDGREREYLVHQMHSSFFVSVQEVELGEIWDGVVTQVKNPKEGVYTSSGVSICG